MECNRIYTLNSKNWFLKKSDFIEKSIFHPNAIELILKPSKKTSIYLISGCNGVTKLLEEPDDYKIKTNTEYEITVHIEKDDSVEIQLYMQELDDTKILKQNSARLKSGLNSICFKSFSKTKYLKLMFKINNLDNQEVKVLLSSLQMVKKGEQKTNIFEKFEQQEVYISNLDEIDIPLIYDRQVLYKIFFQNIKFEFLTFFRKGEDRLVIFSTSAVNRTRNPNLTLPVFNRWKWQMDLMYNTINVMDPTLYKDINAGWFQGEKNHFYLETITVILESFFSSLTLKKSHILFYGSSIGGFFSLMASAYCVGTNALVSNPQIDLTRYSQGTVKKFLKVFDPISVEEARKKYALRFNVADFYHLLDYFPNILYKQTMEDTLHYQKHMLYFLQKVETIKSDNKIFVELYHDERGHNAVADFEEAQVDIAKAFEMFSSGTKQLLKKKPLVKVKPLIDIKYFGFMKNESSLYEFKPRKDVVLYPLSLPLNWNIDPFHDGNWCFQLHSWRMLDNALLEYEKSNDLALLKNIIDIMIDWYDFSVLKEKESEYTWYDMSTGLRALKLAYLLHKFEIITIESKSFSNKVDEIRKLAYLHMNILAKQKISLNNHGIFQAHGLLMLSWVLSEKDKVDYALKQMEILIKQQFYTEGYHSENSDKYHWFVLDTFKRFLSFKVYKQSEFIKKMVEVAEDSKKWTVFPNKESLMIGDSEYVVRKVDFKSDTQEENIFIKFFKESGYLFIRSSFSTPENEASMFFMQTAFKNKTHRHADDFNILLYEYGKNILVDAGQYAYSRDKGRRYALSTQAHNCLLIDNISYDVKNSYFYEPALMFCEEKNGIFLGKTSLKRKEFDVEHHRVFLYKPKAFLIVMDSVVSDKKHLYDQYWHFHQDLVLDELKHGYRTDINQDIQMYIESYAVNVDKKKKQSHTKLYKGQTEPELQGWRSLKYRELTPNYALQNSIKAKKAVLVTKFIFDISLDVSINFLKTKQGISCQMSAFDIELIL